jgi:hypothetical protein
MRLEECGMGYNYLKIALVSTRSGILQIPAHREG